MGEQIKRKMSMAKKIFALILALLLLAGGGYWLWWRSLPPQRFAVWSEGPPPELERIGIFLRIDMMARNDDGSGDIYLIMENKKDEVRYWGSPTISYPYKGYSHQIFPDPQQEGDLSTTPLTPIEPRDYADLILYLPPRTLAMPGVYRITVEGCGWVEFVILDDGKAFIGQPLD